MTRRFVDQLADGENVDEVYLVVDKQLRANRNGNQYIQLDLGDRSGNISARMWNACGASPIGSCSVRSSSRSRPAIFCW